ncbi:MAG: CpaF family protein [Bdellovibrionales bacterium]|nr:CpaF family protein [Bdellovibrionales bacterium]
MSQVPVKKGDLSDWMSQCGPLEPFLRDASVTEVMVNGPHRIFIEQKGLIKKTAARFDNPNELYALMQAMAHAVGKKLDPHNPCVDGRLPDGSRINCVVPPVAVDGPALTIRKFSPHSLTHAQLIAGGFMDDRLAYFLSCAVAARISVLVSGGTGSGKTTLLNVLSSFVPLHERIVSIEDAAELKLRGENVVRLEARPTSLDEPGVSIRQLVVNALRMRPDRIIVGECRGQEAFDMLAAMNTGHEGSMTTIHANSARDALRRLESLVLLAATEMPLKVIRQNITGALQMIVQVTRGPDGVRRIQEVIEVCGMEGDVMLTQDLFRFQASPTPQFKSLGFVPKFVSLFKERGVDFPKDFFTDGYTVRQLGSTKKT